MTVRRCLPWPDRRLRTPASPVTEIDDTVRAVWADMIDTMEAMPGVGLAAPQIGVGLRLAVVDASDARGQAVCMANPEVLHASVQLRDPSYRSVLSATCRRDRTTPPLMMKLVARMVGRRSRSMVSSFERACVTSVNEAPYFPSSDNIRG